MRRLLSGTGALMIMSGMLLTGCGKEPEETKKKKKNIDPDETTQTTTSEPTTTTTLDPDTMHLDTGFWSCDIPKHFMYDQGDVHETDEESHYFFFADADHPSYDFFQIDIVTESYTDFRSAIQYNVDLTEYDAGKLMPTTIDGLKFYTYTDWVWGEADYEATVYFCRYEEASMTIKIRFGDYVPKGSYLGYDILDSISFILPDLGLSDPEPGYLQGEFQSNPHELPLGDFTITPYQAHFSEHVYITSDSGFVLFSSTATHATASGKYLYTYDIRGGMIYIYLITDEEMKLVQSSFVGFEEFSLDLEDGDTVDFYFDPNLPDHFFFVETVDGQQRTLSCLNDLIVSSDGQTIVYFNPTFTDIHKLYLNKDKKEVEVEPLDLQKPVDYADLQYMYITDESIYIRVVTGSGDCPRTFEYDLDGNLVGELTDPNKAGVVTYGLHEFGENLVIIDEVYNTLEIIDREGNTLASVDVDELLGFDTHNPFAHYSFLQVEEGHYLIIYAHDNDGVLEDLVYHIYIHE